MTPEQARKRAAFDALPEEEKVRVMRKVGHSVKAIAAELEIDRVRVEEILGVRKEYEA